MLLSYTLELLLLLLLPLSSRWFLHFAWISIAIALHHPLLLPLLLLLPLWRDPLLINPGLCHNRSSLPSLLLAECSVQALLRVGEALLDQLLGDRAPLAA